MLTTSDAAADELRSLQHAHVLGSRGESHLEGRGELAEVALTTRELPDDRASGGVGQRVKDEVQPGRAIQYHSVYYTKWFYEINQEGPCPSDRSVIARLEQIGKSCYRTRP